jgi:formylglycine-generating enzyme required for sulfatase activity
MTLLKLPQNMLVFQLFASVLNLADDIHSTIQKTGKTPVDTIDVRGKVTLFGDGVTPIPGVTVSVQIGSSSIYKTITDQNGVYIISVPSGGRDYQFSARLAEESRANKGVDVTDIILLRKHIVKREQLSSAMSWVAADPTRDNSIDVADIVEMRKVILNRNSSFSTNLEGKPEDLFRFVKLGFKDTVANLSFDNIGDNEFILFESISGNLTGVDFAGFKLGDVNGDWQSSLLFNLDHDIAIPLGNEVDMHFIKIKAGSFVMGSPVSEPNRRSREGPTTNVTITEDYFLGKFQVTQNQWKTVMGYNPSHFIGDNLPVETITWFEAVEFCRKLTDKQKTEGRLPAGYLFSLPTEAQWEYACRAGTSSIMYYGNDPGYSELGKYAWYAPNSGNTTHPVGQKLPNNWGLYDMHGNVYEWCLDWWSEMYPGGNVTDPVGPLNGNAFKVLRGASYLSSDWHHRAAHRSWGGPQYPFNFRGLRVVLIKE